MDKSFLSNADVIKASRDFVCIRLATYEDAVEAEFLKSFKAGRSGELENTVFVLLAPDGEEKLSKASRGPMEFRSPSALASAMSSITLAFNDNKLPADYVPRLPQMKDFRLGLNVSSCDGLPSIVCVGKDEAQVTGLKKKLAPLAFADELAGKFVFASSEKTTELKAVKGYTNELGFIVIKPGDYGIDGEMVKVFPVTASAEDLKAALTAYANDTSKVFKSHRTHVSTGNKNGTEWKTAIPVTDPGSPKAMERSKGGGSGGADEKKGSRRSRSGGRPSKGGGQ